MASLIWRSASSCPTIWEERKGSRRSQAPGAKLTWPAGEAGGGGERRAANGGGRAATARAPIATNPASCSHR